MVKVILLAILALCVAVDTFGLRIEDCPPGYRCRKRASNPVVQSRVAQTQAEVDIEICPVGTYSPGASEECTPCERGTYAANPGAPACFNCPRGHMCPDVTKSPEQCPINSYNNVVRQTCCRICPAGTSARLRGMFQCDNCHSGERCSARQKLSCENDGATTQATTMEASTRSAFCPLGGTAITFDDLPGGTSTMGLSYKPSVAIPNPYKNIHWTNAYSYSPVTNQTGLYTATVSANNTLYNGLGEPLTMKSDHNSSFVLYSITAAAVWYDNLQLTVIGYRSNVIVTRNTFTLQVFTPSVLTFNGYSRLDTVVFSTSGGTKNSNIKINGDGPVFAMDNICLSFT